MATQEFDFWIFFAHFERNLGLELLEAGNGACDKNQESYKPTGMALATGIALWGAGMMQGGVRHCDRGAGTAGGGG